MKRKLSLLLALLLCAGTLCQSCGNENSGDDETASQLDDSTAREAEIDYLDSLGEKDFGGATYTISSWYTSGPQAICNLHSGEINGEIINDTQYNRDKYVEQRYNVVIKNLALDPEETGRTLSNSLLAGDSIGDVIVGMLGEGTGAMSGLFNNGLLINLLEVPYLQPDREWWSQLMYENLTINDKLYFTLGDLAPNSYLAAACVYMNLKVAEDYGIDENELYSKVYGGTWTMDVLYSLTKDADKDLNNDGKLDCLNDFFGIVNENDSSLLLAGCGVKFSEYNEKTVKLEVNLGTPKVVDIIDSLSKMFKKVDSNGDNTNLYNKNFKSNKSIFAIHYVTSTVSYFRDMESDYVIYPTPKYDEVQETYVSYINPWFLAFIGIPQVQTNLEMTGFITEVLEYLSVKNVRPAVYDVTLKGKALNNEDSRAMLDLIFSTTYFDYNANYKFGGVLDAVNRTIFQGQPYASVYASCEEKMNAELDAFMTHFE